VQLNAHIKALMDQMSAQPGPKLWEVSVDDARNLYTIMSQLTDPQKVAIGATEDLEIESDHGPIPARLYTPAATAGITPLVIFYHGGGFVIGDLETHDAVCRNLTNASLCRVLSVDYRLAPEHKFPAAVEDAFAAAKWAVAHSARLGIDGERIAVAGDSAGGNLAAVVCQLAQAQGGPRIGFQLLIYPVTKMDATTESRKQFAQGYFLEQQTMNWFSDKYVGAADDYRDPRLSPLLAANLEGLPAAMVITAGFDPLKDEGKAYADKLNDAGVPVVYVDYPGMVHGFFSMSGAVPEAREAVENAGRAIAAHFGL